MSRCGCHTGGRHHGREDQAASQPSRPGPLTELQRTVGNRAVAQLLEADCGTCRDAALADIGSNAGPTAIREAMAFVAQRDGDGTPAGPGPIAPAREVADSGSGAAPGGAKVASPTAAVFHVVVRDKDLDLGGGVLVADLAAAKARLMQRQVSTPWTLVLSIHASQNRLGAQAPPDWQKNAVFYTASDVASLFGGDKSFVTWRDQYGPSRVVLYGCQVDAPFEKTIADSLVQAGQGRTAQGLGDGCKPLSTERTYNFGGPDIRSMKAFKALPKGQQDELRNFFIDINQKWGYFGAPPVPDDQVLEYLFGGPKPGSWPTVEVIVKKKDEEYVSTNPPIPFWNRMSNSEFLRRCNQGVGRLKERESRVPSVP